MINMTLAKRLGLSVESINKIEELQSVRHQILKFAQDSADKSDHFKLRTMYEFWLRNERALQSLWGFEINDRFIKHWNFPGCSCPKMDNDENYPSGYYIRDKGCPVHS